MMESLSEWNDWWSSGRVRPEMAGKPRGLTSSLDDLLSTREIKVVTGLRRTGKSTLMFQFVDGLLASRGIDPADVLYVNFDDPFLAGKPLKEVFDAYQRAMNPKGLPYLFLDEVHGCPDWAAFLRRM
ncbi:AAA family ATPase, partial [Candidatus Uhrbacteria bacterium]|nr:AAA family ATPase [Candidatus Uhrbacteria bacterium]